MYELIYNYTKQTLSVNCNIWATVNYSR